MRCRAAQNRLVAFRDEELSPGEATQLAEHLAVCPTCRDLDERLQAVTPRIEVEVEPTYEQQLWDRLDAAVAAELDAVEREPRRLPAPRWTDWLVEETRVPRAALIAYAAVLVAAIGMSVWLVWSGPSAEEPGSAVAVQPTEIPADLYVPAAWHPEEGSED